MQKYNSKQLPYLLVSYPWVEDGIFDQAVILITESTEDGTMGFMLNRPLENKISEIIVDDQALIDDDCIIWYGGPVSSQQGYMLHNLGEFDGDCHVADGAGLSMNIDSLCLLDQVKSENLSETRVRFIVGYCGWAPGQLEQECLEGTWMQIPYDEKLVFDTAAKDLWQRAYASMGVHPELLVVEADTLVH